jgi:hypothetical protein
VAVGSGNFADSGSDALKAVVHVEGSGQSKNSGHLYRLGINGRLAEKLIRLIARSMGVVDTICAGEEVMVVVTGKVIKLAH